MDLTATTTPDSTQVNADDLVVADRIVTITEVKAGSSEQPVDILVQEFPGRAYRPSKSMRRVLIAAWGPEASAYVGRRLRLYRDPEVSFGRDKVGGIKIGAMSHIDKPLSIALTVSRGKRAPHTIQPLPDAPKIPTITDEDIANSTDPDDLRVMWKSATEEQKTLIQAKVAELNGGAA